MLKSAHFPTAHTLTHNFGLFLAYAYKSHRVTKYFPNQSISIRLFMSKCAKLLFRAKLFLSFSIQAPWWSSSFASWQLTQAPQQKEQQASLTVPPSMPYLEKERRRKLIKKAPPKKRDRKVMFCSSTFFVVVAVNEKHFVNQSVVAESSLTDPNENFAPGNLRILRVFLKSHGGLIFF